jgi:hypothetical protein
VRVAVFDRYWSTLGGGEQFAGGIAAALSERFDVELLGPQPVDHERLAERLRLDLSHLPVRLVDTDEEVSAASLDYDLFVNCTYMSPTVNRAKQGMYVVHFPGAPVGRKQLMKDEPRRLAGRAVRRPVVVVRANFLLPMVPGGPRRTDGLGVLDVYAPEGTSIDLVVGTPLAAGRRRVSLSVLSGRTVLGEAELTNAGATISFTSSGEFPQQLTLFTPVVDQAGGPRHADIELRALRIDGRPAPVPGDRMLHRLLPPDRLAFLRSYDTVAANSTFTAGWVERLWGVPSQVLYPPVNPVAPAPVKEHLILSLGRFFDPTRGHCKKQVEMVQAFRSLVERGLAGDWQLHLVGGVSAPDRDYAMQVKAAAQGLPIKVHMNAPGAVVADLLARSSIYWHAGGLGEDPQLHPDRFEHFGIAVVEAMTAGLVPVVFGAAGPAEIVEDGRSGVHFHDVDGLASATERLFADPAQLASLSEGAQARADDFGAAAFRKRLFELVG